MSRTTSMQWAILGVFILALGYVMPLIVSSVLPEPAVQDDEWSQIPNPATEVIANVLGLVRLMGYVGLAICLVVALVGLSLPQRSELGRSSRRVKELRGDLSKELATVPPGMEQEYQQLRLLDSQLAHIGYTIEGARETRIRVANLRQGLELAAIQRQLDALAPEVEAEIEARRLAREELGLTSK